MERFERPRIPVVITGLTDSWDAAEHWTPSALRAKYGEHPFKVCITHHSRLYCTVHAVSR